MTEIVLYYQRNPTESSHTLRLRAASDYTGDPAENFTESTGVHGKPFFPSHPDVQFSVSHTGGLWICAFANRPVGCDVQDHREHEDTSRLLRLAKRWFSPEECRDFEETGYRPTEFYRIWSRKEAYVKFTGNGIGAGDMPSFTVTRLMRDCVIRDIVLPYPKPHSAAVVCGEEFGVTFREL